MKVNEINEGFTHHLIRRYFIPPSDGTSSSSDGTSSSASDVLHHLLPVKLPQLKPQVLIKQ